MAGSAGRDVSHGRAADNDLRSGHGWIGMRSGLPRQIGVIRGEIEHVLLAEFDSERTHNGACPGRRLEIAKLLIDYRGRLAFEIWRIDLTLPIRAMAHHALPLERRASAHGTSGRR